MDYSFIIAIVAILLIVYFLSKRKKTKHGMKVYESLTDEPVEDKKEYEDEIDYFMTPIAEATRLENKPQTNKKELYNVYNEAVARYNRINKDLVRNHPKTPNIETVVNQRDRAYLELLTAHVNEEIQLDNVLQVTAVAVPPRAVAVIRAPIPVAKEKKRDHKLQLIVKTSPQNVHDPRVGDNLSKRYRELKTSNLAPSTDALYAQMLRFIDIHDPKKKIVSGFAKGDDVSRFDNDKEEQIWYVVWRRIYSPDNRENIDSLLNALRDSIIDCGDNGGSGLVCLTGRVTRVLNALTLLDKNVDLSKPIKTDDIERKEVYDDAHKILQRELDMMGPKFKAEYESGDMQDTKVFDEKVKNCIKVEIKESKYRTDALMAI